MKLTALFTNTYIFDNQKYKVKALFFIPHRETEYIPFDEETAKLIWHPKLSFFNLKSVRKLAGFGYVKLNLYYMYKPENNSNNGSASSTYVEMDEILKVTVYCDFDFQFFPFDKQECDLSLYDPVNTASWVIFKEIEYLCYNIQHCNEDENGNENGERFCYCTLT